MNNLTILLYRIIIPKYFRRKIQARRLPVSIFKYYKNYPEALSPDFELILDYLKTNPITMLPYDFQNQYLADDVEVFDDPETGLRYVLQDDKKLYFKRRWNASKIKKVYNDLLKEQDLQSPHRYLSEDFQFDDGEVLIDAGAAEGNFAVSVVEQASRIFLFEPDREWIDPLRATFAPWNDKVTIIHKFAGDINSSRQTTLDDVIPPGDKGLFLKADVEGAELRLLKGAVKIISGQRPLKIAICTYHKHDDERELSGLLSQYDFKISTSEGYMLPMFDKKIKAPYFRRALIRAEKIII